jgi:hypothetical protein
MAFANIIVVTGECTASRFGHFTSGEETFGFHWIGSWVSPVAGILDNMEKR